MKILVIGETGQLGSALMATVPVGVELVTANREACDLSNPEAVRAFVSAVASDVTINAAAFTEVDRAEKDAEKARVINADAVAAMVDACSGTFVQVSTDFVFDGQGSRSYKPRDVRNPLSVYGRTKAEGEDHLRAHDLLVRTAWVYGASGNNFVRTILLAMRERQELNVVSDQIGAPTWVDGLARTIWALIRKKATGSFHHSDAGVASWYDFAIAIQEEALAIGLIEKAIPIKPIPSAAWATAAVRPAFSVLDSSATRELLGDEYTHWRTNLRLMLQKELRLG